MRIVISSIGDTLDSDVDTRFGRCKYFLIVETENKEIKNFSAVQNEGVLQGHGAGIRAAEQIGELKPDAVITGNLGPNASNVLSQLKVQVYHGSGKVNTTIAAFLEGKLQRLTEISRAHSGMR
ncbi:NifB/NifX family molybdenum-iron cluster-binding protein [Candidatus Woesearchaeota archaeon]|nr:NifB/NifX family molybdenum-iron cluster-binding protein [Candidatus Woesearchaeota archaeon]